LVEDDRMQSNGDAMDRVKSRDLRQLRRLAGYLKDYRLQVAGAIVALVVAAAAVLSLGIGLRYLIDSGFAEARPEALDHALRAAILVILALAVSTFLRSYLVAWLGERIVARIRSEVYSHIIRMPPGFFETTRTGEVLSRLTTDTTVVQTVIGSTVTQALRNILLTLGGVVLLVVTNPKLTGLVLLVVPLVVVPIVVFGRMVRRLSRQAQDRLADVSGQAEETVNAVRTVQAFAQEERETGSSPRRAMPPSWPPPPAPAPGRCWRPWSSRWSSVPSSPCSGWAGATCSPAPSPRASFPPSSSSPRWWRPPWAVSPTSSATCSARPAPPSACSSCSTASPRSRHPANPLPLPAVTRGEVRFDRVSFAYPSQPGRLILEELDLVVRSGERVALVGPSGAGKTSVFQLLMRFYDPSGGRILLDGQPIDQLEPSAYRARLGLVPQEPVIFSADAWANIRYGRPEATDAEVVAAAEAAAARGFIEALPQGFATFLGEKGVRLSGGQRQRVAIARAILSDPAVLLLDEATSSLDAESEHAVQQALDNLMRSRTSIVIAHRLATVLKADRILVMEEGRIVDVGTHPELIRRGGLYARLANLQFRQGEAA
jgi:ATP-binding cassette, subfamily B, bacterial